MLSEPDHNSYGGETCRSDRPLTFNWTISAERRAGAGIPPVGHHKLQAAVGGVLAEALLAHEEGQWVSYSRRRAFYVGQQRYRGTAFTYEWVTRAVDSSFRKGLIQEERAAPGERGWQSRFRARPELVDALGDTQLSYELRGLIRLKDEHGRLIGFSETDRTRRMHRELERLNQFLGEIDLQLDAPDVRRTPHHLIVGDAYFRPTRPAVYRVFNRRSFRLGGRAYGWWQSLPKLRRQQILISGVPTVEPDYAQLHPSMLYARRGLRLTHDPYETGVFSREQGKLGFNVALNAATLPGAIAALDNKAGWALSRKETARLIQELKRRNPEIAEDLHADQGVGLMRIDSEIMLMVMQRCMKESIAALPVHDSVLTSVHHGARVAEIMEESAAVILNIAQPCSVRFSSNPIPHMPSPLPVPPLRSSSPSRPPPSLATRSGEGFFAGARSVDPARSSKDIDE